MTTLREAGERLEGAKRAVARAEVERSTFAVENADGLIAERRPDALAAVEEVEAAVQRLSEAHGRWHAVSGEVAGLLRLAGRDSRDIPSFPAELEELVRDARRAGGVPVPAPLPVHAVVVPALEQPLPDREAA
jgi:ABC-type taurine transport system substrate-binding protein